MKLTAIAAVAQNGVIGKDNDLIWHLPNDLKHFKNLTKGHTIIMGRKTWESIGAKPLPHRRHIVITRNAEYVANGAEVVTSVEAAIALIENDDQPYIVGGAEIYRLAMPHVQRLELTYVHHNFEGDTIFPEFDKAEWELSKEERHETDEKHKWAYTFVQLNRKA
jgi:dihydrofolate reductase